MKKFHTGDEVVCKVTGMTGHVFNVIPGNLPGKPELYEVLWDNLRSTREPAWNLISQGETVIPPSL